MDNVYQNSANCCGCGTCMIVCPKHAISMKCDEKGFVYPTINSDICIDCGACRKVCSFSKKKDKKVSVGSSECYAACNTNQSELGESTSGGVFSAVAHLFLEQGGVVCGACMELENGEVHVYHTIVDTKSKLSILQGSKYVQSNLWECLETVDVLLKEGRNVLFSGTPCQVDAVKGRFGKYLATQLFTIDIICHGVPSTKFLGDFLKEYQRTHDLKIEKLIFRDKKYGWGLNGQIIASNTAVKFTKNDFSYYKYFLDGETYRDSCYTCPYSCPKRVGDITIGDYWGIKNYDPQLLMENGGTFDFKQGVSCLIVNDERGIELLEKFGGTLQKAPIEIQNVMKINKQLREPAKHTELRDKIFSLYTKKGYSAVEKLFRKQQFRRNIKNKIKAFIKR